MSTQKEKKGTRTWGEGPVLHVKARRLTGETRDNAREEVMDDDEWSQRHPTDLCAQKDKKSTLLEPRGKIAERRGERDERNEKKENWKTELT
jgi:hypothetical protein